MKEEKKIKSMREKGRNGDKKKKKENERSRKRKENGKRYKK